MSEIGLYGLAVMGQNLALNIAEKGFKISVCNRSPSKVDLTVNRAQKELADKKDNLLGFKDMKEFVQSLKKPRNIIILVKAGNPVEAVLSQLFELLDKDDLIIDGGNEWYENTERRTIEAHKRGYFYIGMGVSGGEDGARYGPSLMPGGDLVGYQRVEHILQAVAAKVDKVVCVDYIGVGASGNYVKMVHNGIEYGDMQLIAEIYDILKTIGRLSNEKLSAVFKEWNKGKLNSFLVEITGEIFGKKDDRGKDKNAYLVDKVLDKSGSKGTGCWTVMDAAKSAVAAPSISAALNARYLSSLKNERIEAQKTYFEEKKQMQSDKIDDVDLLIEQCKNALYASKICCYAQGMHLLQSKSNEKGWNLKLQNIAAIWKSGCIIRAQFLDRITAAYVKDAKLKNLLLNPEFVSEIKAALPAWKSVIKLAVENGVPIPALYGSFGYFNTYTCARLPANLTQSQRDFFGAHTYQRLDFDQIDECKNSDEPFGNKVHSQWSKL